MLLSTDSAWEKFRTHNLRCQRRGPGLTRIGHSSMSCCKSSIAPWTQRIPNARQVSLSDVRRAQGLPQNVWILPDCRPSVHYRAIHFKSIELLGQVAKSGCFRRNFPAKAAVGQRQIDESLDTITSEKIAGYARHRQDAGMKVATVNRELQVLRRIRPRLRSITVCFTSARPKHRWRRRSLSRFGLLDPRSELSGRTVRGSPR